MLSFGRVYKRTEAAFLRYTLPLSTNYKNIYFYMKLRLEIVKYSLEISYFRYVQENTRRGY